jgi:hypothetical protein
LDRAALHAAHLFGSGFLVVLSFDSRLESIIEKWGWGSPKSPKRLMTPAVQTATSGSFFVYPPSSAVFRVLSHFATGKQGLDPADGA